MYIDVFLGESCGEKSYFAAEKLTYDDVGYNLNSFNFYKSKQNDLHKCSYNGFYFFETS